MSNSSCIKNILILYDITRDKCNAAMQDLLFLIFFKLNVNCTDLGRIGHFGTEIIRGGCFGVGIF